MTPPPSAEPSGTTQPPEKKLWMSSAVWGAFKERAADDGISVNQAAGWLYAAYAIRHITVPVTDTPRDAIRKPRGVRPDPDILAEAENRAIEEGFKNISVFSEILFQDYADGKILFTPLMTRGRRRSKPRHTP